MSNKLFIYQISFCRCKLLSPDSIFVQIVNTLVHFKKCKLICAIGCFINLLSCYLLLKTPRCQVGWECGTYLVHERCMECFSG